MTEDTGQAKNLLSLPQELISQICHELAAITPDPGTGIGCRCEKHWLWKSCSRLKMACRKLKNMIDEAFASFVKSDPKVIHFTHMKYFMTEECLLRLDAVSKNASLAPLIKTIEYTALDPRHSLSDPNVRRGFYEAYFGKKDQYQNLIDSNSIPEDMLSEVGPEFPDDGEARLFCDAFAYMKQLSNLNETGRDLQILTEALKRLPNVQELCLSRYQYRNFARFAVYSQIDIRFCKELVEPQHLGSCEDEIDLTQSAYLYSFFNLAYAAKDHNITHLQFKNVVPEMSLVPISYQLKLFDTLGSVEHLTVYADPGFGDSANNPEYARDCCALANLEREKKFWRTLASKSQNVRRLYLVTEHNGIWAQPGSISSCTLLECLLEVASFANVEELHCIGFFVFLPFLKSFLDRHSNGLKCVCMEHMTPTMQYPGDEAREGGGEYGDFRPSDVPAWMYTFKLLQRLPSLSHAGVYLRYEKDVERYEDISPQLKQIFEEYDLEFADPEKTFHANTVDFGPYIMKSRPRAEVVDAWEGKIKTFHDISRSNLVKFS